MELASEEANLSDLALGSISVSSSHGASAPTPGEYIMSVLYSSFKSRPRKGYDMRTTGKDGLGGWDHRCKPQMLHRTDK